MSLVEEWVRDSLPDGSAERRQEIRVLAAKKGWVTRRERENGRLRGVREAGEGVELRQEEDQERGSGPPALPKVLAGRKGSK